LWRDQILQQSNEKLGSYITFKSNFGREKYLSVLKKVLNRGDALHSYVLYSNILIVTVEVSFQLRTPRDDAQGTVICRPPRVQSKKREPCYFMLFRMRGQMLQQTNGKLRTYITFKSNFGREKYLSVLKSFGQIHS
jgi:uncharacterized protein Veg